MNKVLSLRIIHATKVCMLLFACGTLPARADDALNAGAAVALTGTHGRFDFLAIDADGRRLLAAHTGNGSLDIIDLDKKEIVKIVPTGKAQAPAVDARSGRYYVTTSVPPQLVTVDARKLEVVDKVPLA